MPAFKPRAMHRSYLVDSSRVDLANHRGPSTGMACEICAGVTGVEALKILLDRGNVKAAPWFHQFDAYTGRFVSRRLPGGSRHIGQRLKQKLGLRMMRSFARNAPPARSEPSVSEPRAEIWRILDLARWAPSGDNSQPWRFRIDGDDAVTILIKHKAGANVYEYNNGQPTLLSAGKGVVLGWDDRLTDEQWREKLEAALGGPYIVQRRIRPTVELFPDEDGELQPWNVLWGMFTVANGYGGANARAIPAAAGHVVMNGANGAYSGPSLYELP